MWHKLNNIKQIDFEGIIELTCRLYVFIFLNVYGFAKLFGGQFYIPSRIPEEISQTPIGQVSDFDLAWTFMGRSFGYMLFIGLSEIIGAWMLLFNRTKLIGVTILIPVMVNVIVFDIFFLDAYGALGSATIYFTMLLVILYINKDSIKQAFKNLTDLKVNSKNPLKKRITVYAIVVVLMALIFTIDQLIVNWLGHGKG
jgi:hypothetical protein